MTGKQAAWVGRDSGNLNPPGRLHLHRVRSQKNKGDVCRKAGEGGELEPEDPSKMLLWETSPETPVRKVCTKLIPG